MIDGVILERVSDFIFLGSSKSFDGGWLSIRYMCLVCSTGHGKIQNEISHAYIVLWTNLGARVVYYIEKGL